MKRFLALAASAVLGVAVLGAAAPPSDAGNAAMLPVIVNAPAHVKPNQKVMVVVHVPTSRPCRASLLLGSTIETVSPGLTSTSGQSEFTWTVAAHATRGTRTIRVTCRGIAHPATARIGFLDGSKARGHRLTNAIRAQALTSNEPPAVSGLGAAGYPAYGQVLVPASSWFGHHGVAVMSNGSSSNVVAPDYYQCVELVNRFLTAEGFGPAIGGNANQIYANATDSAYERHPNGSGYVPVPGDIIVLGGGEYGHVMIVDQVTANTVYTVEQNASASGRNAVSLAGSTLGRVYGMSVIGVIHAKANQQSAASTAPSIVARNPTVTSTVRLPDGRIVEFGVNSSLPVDQDNVYYAYETTGGAWSGWVGLKGHLTSISAIANPDGSLAVFGVNATQPTSGTDVYYAYQSVADGPWSDWVGLKGYLTSVSAVRNPDGTYTVFGVNTTQPTTGTDVYYATQSAPGGSWSGWFGLKGYLTSVSALRNPDGTYVLFGANATQPVNDTNVYYAYQSVSGGSWSGWVGLKGYLTSVSAVPNADGSVTLFGANATQPTSDTDVYYAVGSVAGGSWSGWNGLRGYLTSVSALANSDGSYLLFGVNATQPTTGTDVYYATGSADDEWSTWAGLKGYLS